MSGVSDAGDIETLLQRIGETGALPDAYAADPGSLFLSIHDQWVENGGKVGGKTRNSIRNLMDMLEAAGTPVPSLRSKLNGETRLKLEDAVALLDVYFSHWNITSSDNQDEVTYLSLKVVDSEKTKQIMIQSLFGNQKSTLLPKIQRDRKGISKRPTLEADDSTIFGQDQTYFRKVSDRRRPLFMSVGLEVSLALLLWQQSEDSAKSWTSTGKLTQVIILTDL